MIEMVNIITEWIPVLGFWCLLIAGMCWTGRETEPDHHPDGKGSFWEISHRKENK